MKKPPPSPPFAITPAILAVVGDILRLVGQYEGLRRPKPQLKLRRINRIRTVQGSLAIEGNRLSIEQVSALLDKKRVIGPPREILEAQNALLVYEKSSTFKPEKESNLLAAHGLMMKGLIPDAGRYRSKAIGVIQGQRLAHLAPPSGKVPGLIKELFRFLEQKKTPHPLIRSSLFHYELEFIHPFSDGNGRIGRFWQHLMLVRFHPLFEFVPLESALKAKQQAYYRAIDESNRAGEGTIFIELMLQTLVESLEEFLTELKPEPISDESRLEQAKEHFGRSEFSRKDYLNFFKTVSTATASRDLKHGVDVGQLKKTGEKALTRYRFVVAKADR